MTEIPEYIFERLQCCVAETLGVGISEVKPNSRLAADLHADSLDAVEFVMRVEEEFGFSIEDEGYDRYVYEDVPVSDMEAFIKQKMEPPHAPSKPHEATQ